MMSPQPPQPAKPNYDAFATLNSFVSPPPQSTTPVPTIPQQKQPAQPAQQHSADPFAALMSSSRTSTPLPQQQRRSPQPPSTSTLLDLGQFSAAAPAPASNGQAVDDEWNFASSLPTPQATLPSTNRIDVLNSAVKIEFASQRQPSQTGIAIVALFSNNTSQPISRVEFQVAVEKVCASCPSKTNYIANDLVLHSPTQTSVWRRAVAESTKWYSAGSTSHRG